MQSQYVVVDVFLNVKYGEMKENEKKNGIEFKKNGKRCRKKAVKGLQKGCKKICEKAKNKG